MPTSPGQVPDQLATVRIGAAVRDQPAQDVVRILPDRLGDDQRGVGIDAGEDRHALLLGADEAVPQPSACRDGRGPAVRRASQTAAPSACSIAACAGQHFWLADSRRSPLAIR